MIEILMRNYENDLLLQCYCNIKKERRTNLTNMLQKSKNVLKD